MILIYIIVVVLFVDVLYILVDANNIIQFAEKELQNQDARKGETLKPKKRSKTQKMRSYLLGISLYSSFLLIFIYMGIFRYHACVVQAGEGIPCFRLHRLQFERVRTSMYHHFSHIHFASFLFILVK